MMPALSVQPCYAFRRMLKCLDWMNPASRVGVQAVREYSGLIGL